ncbi:MAG TPA: cytochrome c family protein, partial [Candidatus Polarisedimenticolia bacterium]|nr:cytochrome c family protein [Candidatus Polarisedimenticolia bacterium]
MKKLSRAEFDLRRNEMLQVCTSCHATSFARESLADADAIKRQTDRMVDRAAEIVEAVHRAGALRPRPEERAPNPVEGAVLVMGTHQLYENTSPLEQRFFEMASFHAPTAWKGAYHSSPDHTHWLGNMKVKESLIYIEGEARQLLNGAPLPGDRAPFEKAPAPFSPTFIPPSETGVPFKTGAKYLGDRYCEGCHEDIYRSWRKTDMAATFNSLYPGADRESKAKALNIDPDADFTNDATCFPCHTTGYGQPGGFVSFAKTPNRVGVQCEACHGPASEYMDHMVAGKGAHKSAGLVRADVRACVQCHHPSDPCPDDKYVFDYVAMKARGLHAMHAR